MNPTYLAANIALGVLTRQARLKASHGTESDLGNFGAADSLIMMIPALSCVPSKSLYKVL